VGCAYEAFHRGRWGAALQPTGVQLGTLLSPVDVATPWKPRVQANVSLIRSLDSEAQTRVEGIIFRGFQARTPANQIARELSEALGMSRARARRIASDQPVKLSAQLDTARMQQAGIEEFTWVHSGKVHYRPWHLARNGKRFKLEGDIPPDDMPGIPPFCGCRKRAELPLD
jgi:SPP1 gp7 family putative phage head morphogenesis protein